MSTSVLDDATIARLRMESASGSPFVDPAVFREAQTVLPGVDREWLNRIIGYPVLSWSRLTCDEMTLAVRAAKIDADYLQSLHDERLAEYRAAERARAEEAAAAARAEWEAWEALRERLPVAVEVWHNWTARHLDGYEQGADHIGVLEDLTVGRFHRKARYPLCWTPSRAHELRHVTPNVGDEKRLPECKACLRHAERLAALPVGRHE